MSLTSALVRSMRPKQWTKNLFVFAGLLFTLDQPHETSDFVKVGLAFVLFCLLSGAVYLINDIRDVEKDRKHPIKSNRPIASGALPINLAWSAALASMAVGLGGAFLLDLRFAEIAAAYAALLTTYSFFLKDLVILDVITIATGFVLRAAAGAVVIGVAISPWLLMCTVLLALFLGLAKRRAELVRVEAGMQNHRMSLEQYSIPLLDQLIGITAAATIIAYALYTFFSRTGEVHEYLMVTIPFVIYGVFRYLLLIHNSEGTETPEMMLLGDKPLLIDVGLWALTSAIIVMTK